MLGLGMVLHENQSLNFCFLLFHTINVWTSNILRVATFFCLAFHFLYSYVGWHSWDTKKTYTPYIIAVNNILFEWKKNQSKLRFHSFENVYFMRVVSITIFHSNRRLTDNITTRVDGSALYKRQFVKCTHINLSFYVISWKNKFTNVFIHFIFGFERTAVRLGEYDISTTEDGKHETIRVDHAIKHKQFRLGAGINDIALVFLVDDVEFTGKFQNVFIKLPLAF